MAATARVGHAGHVGARDQYLSLLVATDAALLVILALVAKKRLEWKPPAPQPIYLTRRHYDDRFSRRRRPRRPGAVLVVCICVAVLAAEAFVLLAPSL